MTLLNQFQFKGNQEKAVTDAAHAIAVTAGAGSGKTLSLVGRYLHLLEQGYPIRSILAITFTEKAAREMRSRIRSALSPLPQGEAAEGVGVRVNLDSARIGTIHSLCAEILRTYPAEVELDPAAEVLEEGLAFALQARAIDAALAWAVSDVQAAALFEIFKENELRQILNAMMARRLDVQPLYTDLHGTEQEQVREDRRTGFELGLSSYLAAQLDSPTWINSLADLSIHQSASPEDKLELARQAVLATWKEIQEVRAGRQWDAVLISLTALRKAISTQGQKNNWRDRDAETVRAAMRELRDLYDEHLKFLAEKSRFSLDELVAARLPAVHRLFQQTLREYARLKDHQHASRLDFDDLESLNAQLLTRHPAVGEQIQSGLRAVLVDEFQDTNDRQRQIVYALTGFNPQSKIGTLTPALAPGASENAENADKKISENRRASRSASNGSSAIDLFVVGDSKQSIYRFRSADVTVFRKVQSDIQSAGGEIIGLDLTFRAHKLLLDSLNSLLSPILGETDDPARPYLIPFAPLHAYRQTPARENIQPPFIEFHLGLGENAEEGRQAAAQSLAHRLRELHQTEGFAWGDMALLFRSSTVFPIYETALEVADIPFITVAGRGFYGRPEIRDLLNALTAIADPTDNLALVGLLRSPAFAIPDAEIYKLRYPNQSTTPSNLFESLKRYTQHGAGTHAQADTYAGKQRNTEHIIPKQSGVDAPDSQIHPSLSRAYDILTELHSLAGRAPAAAVLKRLLDLTHYRAILSTDLNGARLIRNVDKLLADAHRSRLVSLTDFLAYIQTLRDVSFCEGEAPADPASAGALQLMTVHKAKGLEFPLTVIADASYEHRGNSSKIQLADSLLLDLRADDLHPTAWQLAARREDELDDAEDRRLLYVAATRAKEKLLVSGYVKQKKDGLELRGWLGKFPFLERVTPERPLLENGIYAAVYPYSRADASDATLSLSKCSPQPAPTSQTESPRESDLLEPLATTSPLADAKVRARESDPPQRVWRIVSTLRAQKPRAPSWLVGRLVHESLRCWRFPADDFESFLRPFALESGLTDEAEIHAAIQESRRMLERLHAHPLFKELDSAERRHEVPYYSPEERGIIDLLYRTDSGWHIIDFKTDEVRSEEEARETIRRAEYDRQMARYARAAANQLGVQAKTRLVFLNLKGSITIFDL
jgi:ATP-dependent exoDNAse (exonuclease V) beta subunit